MVNEGIAKGEPHPEPENQGPQDFVVVLAYTSSDGEIEEEFGQMVQDIKALYTFKNNVRAYAVVEESAKKVLAQVEKSTAEPSGKAVMVISYDQPGDVHESYDRLTHTADMVRDLFKDAADVKVNVAIRETADEVLRAFPESNR